MHPVAINARNMAMAQQRVKTFVIVIAVVMTPMVGAIAQIPQSASTVKHTASSKECPS